MKGVLSPLVRAMLADHDAAKWLCHAKDGDRITFQGRVYVMRRGPQ